MTALVVAMTASDARAECKPAAVPVGDPVLVQRVSERLTAIGITTAAVAGCPAVHVHLERRGEQLHLRVADGYQRQGEREVRDVATAAAVIESWTVQEIEDGALPALAAPATPLRPAARPERAALVLAASSSVATDASAWLGAELAGCWRVRWACAGATTTLLAATATTNDATRGAQRSRELHAFALLEVPRAVGRFVVSPGAGLGYGWASFAAQHTDAHALPLSVEETAHSLRGRLQLRVAWELAGGLALAATLSADAAAVRTQIADAPRARLDLALGLRYGVR